MSADWISKYVSVSLLVAPAVAGSYQTIGAAFGAYKIGPISGAFLEEYLHTWPIAGFLSPLIGTVPESQVLAIYQGKSYNINNIDKLFGMANGEAAGKQFDMFRRAVVNHRMAAPNRAANYYVIIGTGVSTGTTVTVD